MCIISIDLGKTMGISVNVNGEFEHKEEYKFKSYMEFYNKVNGYDPILENYSDYGFSGYLKKPFSVDQLVQLLHDIL